MFRTLTLFLTLAAASGTLSAGVILTVGNPDIAGPAGSTIGWDFSLTSTDHILTVANVVLLPDAPFGTFQDLLSTRLGFTVGTSSVSHSELYSAILNTGIAQFSIDPGTAPGTVHHGTLYFVYNLYTVSPYSPTFDPFNPDHTVSEGNLVEVPVSITVTSTPEPATLLPVAVSCALGLFRWRRQRRTAPVS